MTEKLSFKKTGWKVLCVLLAVYFGLGLALFFFQNNFIYYPDRRDFETCAGFRTSEKIYLENTRLYFRKNSDKLVVFYHGNAGSACDRSFLRDEFEQLGYSYAFVEYTGYSTDKRKPSQQALLKNVEETNNFLKNYNFREIVIAGESLGASFALYHSSIFNENKLLLIAPFHRMSEVARRYYFFYPVSLMLKDDYDNEKWINDIRSVKIIHGDTDPVISPSQSKILFEKIRSDFKELIYIQGAGHNSIYEFPRFYQEVRSYLLS